MSNEFILLLVPLAFFLLVAVARALVRKDLPMTRVWLTIKVALFGFLIGRGGLLADGRHVVAVIASEGWLRRASFRDPPAAEVSCPVVETAGCTLADGLLVTDVRIHPVRPSRWMIEGIGFRVESGAAVHPVGEVGFLAAPDEMVRRCIGAVGPPMVAANGAITRLDLRRLGTRAIVITDARVAPPGPGIARLPAGPATSRTPCGFERLWAVPLQDSAFDRERLPDTQKYPKP